MRVIAGEKRGRKLSVISGKNIRPTADKVKGAIFNSLQTEIKEAKIFIDLFAGSGSMGIEALSRNVNEAYFFDIEKASIEIINKNIKLTGYEQRAQIFNRPALQGIEMLRQNKVKCDIIFIDPPYKNGSEINQLLEIIAEKEILSENGKVVIESEKSVIMPIEKNNLECYKSKIYGISKVSYYCREKKEFESSSISREF